MTIQIGIQTEKTEGIDVLRDHLGNTGQLRKNVTPILREGARVGSAAARGAAPKGATGRLGDQIADDAIVFRIRDDLATARFGVQPVPNPGRGSRLYPLFVHEGTGLYGRMHRLIASKRGNLMVFPGGGKPWPTMFGTTGKVVKLTVRGQHPQPYMRVGYEAASAYVESQLADLLNRLVD